MKNQTEHIQGIIFDFGGTLDTHGVHWSEQFWDAWQTAAIPVSKPDYERAYVAAGESLLEGKIKPTDTFSQTIGMQIRLQMNYLIDQGKITREKAETWSEAVREACYTDVLRKMEITREILKYLATKFPLALVSNYYGNMETVLQEMGIRSYFKTVVDSALVGLRKPDPAIFTLGVKQLNLNPAEVAVVGDSFERDIVPAKNLGCTTFWIKGRSWREEPGGPEADFILENLISLKKYFDNSY
ncbi:MAG: HAD family hydrolase [Bacteroidales bacterium]